MHFSDTEKQDIFQEIQNVLLKGRSAQNIINASPFYSHAKAVSD